MNKILITLALFIFINSSAQVPTISPLESNDYCPNQNLSFAVTIPGNAVWAYPNEGLNPRVTSIAYVIISSVSSPSYNSNSNLTTFSFSALAGVKTNNNSSAVAGCFHLQLYCG